MTDHDPHAQSPHAQGPQGGPYPPYPPPPVAPKRRRGCLWWLGLGTAAFVGLIIVIVVVAVLANGGEDDGGDDTTTATTSEEGPSTNSGNTENPPTEDVELGDCGPGVGNPAGGNLIGAAGTITNHSSEPSDYVFTVEFVTPDGTRYDESFGSATAVAADQTVEWGVPGFEESRPDTECRITQVERLAS